jgi:hypothetical protein
VVIDFTAPEAAVENIRAVLAPSSLSCKPWPSNAAADSCTEPTSPSACRSSSV